MNLYPVIMCGGAGTRLWPASRQASPKQFIPLIGQRSVPGNPRAGRGLADGASSSSWRASHDIAAQLAAIDVRATPAGARGARFRPRDGRRRRLDRRRDPEGVAVLSPPITTFPTRRRSGRPCDRAAVAAAGPDRHPGRRPHRPASTAYGYIQPGEPRAAPGVRAVESLRREARRRDGRRLPRDGYLWNSGNFIVAAERCSRRSTATRPRCRAARAAVAQAPAERRARSAGPGFSRRPNISIDYAVMEQTDRAASRRSSSPGPTSAPGTPSGRPRQRTPTATPAWATPCWSTPHSLVRAAGHARWRRSGEDLAVIVENDAVLVCDLGPARGSRRSPSRSKADGRRGRTSAASGLASEDLRATWLFGSALPLWWALGADHQGGGFHEALDFDGAPTNAPRRARVQARQAYAYAKAGALGWPGPWRTAAEHAWTAFDPLPPPRRPLSDPGRRGRRGLDETSISTTRPSPRSPSPAAARAPAGGRYADGRRPARAFAPASATAAASAKPASARSSPTPTCTCSRHRLGGSRPAAARPGARWRRHRRAGARSA